MNIRIICIGKLKEPFYRDACGEYAKRLSRYTGLEIVELSDEKAPEQLSQAQKRQLRLAEGRRVLSRIAPEDLVVAMAIEGREMDSESLARQLEDWMGGGRGRLDFVIGGSLGLSGEVLDRADFTLSFGKNTFPHQLFRVMLLEQLYRCFKILNREPYHK